MCASSAEYRSPLSLSDERSQCVQDLRALYALSLVDRVPVQTCFEMASDTDELADSGRENVAYQLHMRLDLPFCADGGEVPTLRITYVGFKVSEIEGIRSLTRSA